MSPSLLARLLAGLLATGLCGCKHVPTEREIQGAQIHFDLGVNAQTSGDVQTAYREYQQAVEKYPDFAEAHNALGILLHLSFKRPQEALVHYQQAVKLKPAFSDAGFTSQAKTNLANLYLDLARYDEAIALYQEALNDMLYATPYIAQHNLGWAHYKRGDTKREDHKLAVESIKAAVTTNPKFCLGYKNLGIIFDEQGKLEDACKNYGRYRENCPDVADAHYREGVCLAKLGQNDAARKAFAACQTKNPSEPLKEDCKRLLDHLQ
jgi:tetratricopeptide (TPR) repeat protein